MGDAGAILTDDYNLSQKMKMFARHGGLSKGEHLIEGINSRMDGIQGAVLSIKLKYIDEWNKRRQEIANKYLNNLKNKNLILPYKKTDVEHVWHLFVIKNKNRDQLKDF